MTQTTRPRSGAGSGVGPCHDAPLRVLVPRTDIALTVPSEAPLTLYVERLGAAPTQPEGAPPKRTQKRQRTAPQPDEPDHSLLLRALQARAKAPSSA